MLVESLVGEVVGAFVLLARNVLDLDVRKRGQQLFRASVERLKPLLLDPIASVHLLDDQLGVEAHLERVGLPRLDCFETVDEGVVLGLVVGHHPQPAVHGLQLHALLVLDDDARGGGTWIAARGAVCPEAQELRQLAARMRPQFSHCTSASPLRRICMPDEVTVTWHAAHWVPFTRAIGGRTRIRLKSAWSRGGTWAQIASFSVMTSASSVFHSASWVRRPGSSSVDVRLASSSSLLAERTDSSAASASSMIRSWASSSSTKRAFMCATSSDICMSSVGLRMRPLMSSFCRERRRERWSSRTLSDSRRRLATSSCLARAEASVSSRSTMAGSDSSLASVAASDSRSARSRSTSA